MTQQQSRGVENMQSVNDFVKTNKSLQKGLPNLPRDMDALIEKLMKIPEAR
jgi:hypothetical protein